jgi:CDP-diacylglycerol--glycerol-3-phosphate 3-phosphatidyltransferase
MNLPNKITCCRFALIPVFVLVVLLVPDWQGQFIGLIIFIIASLTDALDGHIARSRNLVTDFGKFMDPLVDKMLVTSALLLLVGLGLVPSWVVIVILTREFAITGLRTLAVEKGLVVAASNLGKLKTVSQMLAICFLFCSSAPFVPNDIFYLIGQVLMYLALAFTVISGLDYIIKCKEVFKDC